jgi:hypothetical protein
MNSPTISASQARIVSVKVRQAIPPDWPEESGENRRGKSVVHNARKSNSQIRSRIHVVVAPSPDVDEVLLGQRQLFFTVSDN